MLSEAQDGRNPSDFTFMAFPSCMIDTKNQKNVFVCISGCQKRHLNILTPSHCACVFMCMNELVSIFFRRRAVKCTNSMVYP